MPTRIIKWFFLSAAIGVSALIVTAQPALAQMPPSTLPVARSRDYRQFEPKTYLYLKYPQEAPLMAKIINCESGWRADAENAHSTASGLAQFLDSTWMRIRVQMGRDPDLALKKDPYENIDSAVALLHAYGKGQWECVTLHML